MTWRPIEELPGELCDGRLVRLRRVHEGRLVREGAGRFGHLHGAAPARSGVGLDPLGRLSAADYQREASDREAWVAGAKWLTEDRMYAFPTPTHWQEG